MSSDQENYNDAVYSDDSDYQHHDSVLSTGHKNSVANRNSVTADRRSKRVSYGRKHNQSQVIEDILKKNEQEAKNKQQLNIHQTQSHIVNSDVPSKQQGGSEINNEQSTEQSQIIHENQKVQEKQNNDQSAMLISMNDSNQGSEIFENLQVSQSQQEVKAQQPEQSTTQYLEQSQKVQSQEIVATVNQTTTEEVPDYLPQERFVEQTKPSQQKVQQVVHAQTQQQTKLDQPTVSQQEPITTQQQEFRQRSLSNNSEQRRKFSSQIQDNINQQHGHSLGDQFNVDNNEQRDEQILQSFRDSTQQKRRNRIPGNSQIEYGDPVIDYEQSRFDPTYAGQKPQRKESDEYPTDYQPSYNKAEQVQQIKNVEVQVQVNTNNEQNVNTNTQTQQIVNTEVQQKVNTEVQQKVNIEVEQINNTNQQEVVQQQPVVVEQEKQQIITSMDQDWPQQYQPKQSHVQQTLRIQQQTVPLDDGANNQVQTHQQVHVQHHQQHPIQQKANDQEINKESDIPISQPPQVIDQEQQDLNKPQVQVVQQVIEQIKQQESVRKQSQNDWPQSYGKQQEQKQQQVHHNEQQKHQQIKQPINQEPINQSPINQQPIKQQIQEINDEIDNQNNQPLNQDLDKRIQVQVKQQQAQEYPSQYVSNIIPPSSYNDQQKQFVADETQHKPEQVQNHQQKVQQQNQSDFQKMVDQQSNYNKSHPSQIVASQIRAQSVEVAQLKSEPASQIHAHKNDQTHQQVNHNQNKPIHSNQELISKQNQIQSEFIRVDQSNDNYIPNQSDIRFNQSDIPPPSSHQQTHQQPQKHVSQQIKIQSQQIAQPIRRNPQIKKNQLQASQYFVVDKNLSSLDIYGKSQYQQAQNIKPIQQQPSAQRQSVLPYPKKLVQTQQQQKKTTNNVVVEQRQSKPKIQPDAKQARSQQKLKEEQHKDELKNSVSNADMIMSTNQMKSTKQNRKSKAGQTHKNQVDNPQSCKCIIF